MTGSLGNALLWNLLSLGLGQAFNLTRVVVTGRVLEPEDFGLFGMATMVIAGLAIFSDFGFKQALIVHGAHEGSHQRTWLNTIWTADLVAKAVLSLLLVAVAFPAATLFHDARLMVIVLALSAAPILSALSNPGIFALEQEMAFRRVAMMEVLTAGLGAVIVIVLALWLRSVWALVFGHLLGTLLGAALSYTFSRYRPSLNWDREVLRKSLHFGKHLMLVGVLTYATTQFDNLVIGSRMGAAALGFYLIAYRLSEIPALLISAGANRVLLPFFVRAKADSGDVIVDVWQRIFLATLWLCLVFYLPIMLFPVWTITTIFGEKWHDAGALVAILAIAGLFRTLARSIGPVAQSVGRPDIDSKAKIVEVAVFVPGVLIAVNTGGASHVAWVVVLTYAIALLLRLVFIMAALQIQYAPFLLSVARMLTGATLTAAAVYWFETLASGSQLVLVIGTSVLFTGLAYFLSPDLRQVFTLLRIQLGWRPS